MAQFTEEEYRKVRLRGFEPADGYNPLIFTECYSIKYDEYTYEQTAVDVPVSIMPIGNLTDWVRGDIILDKIVWFSKVPAASTSTPAGAVGIRVTTGSHVEDGDTWGDATIYFVDENGNNLENSFFINSVGINEESIMPGHSGDCYITLCYRTDLSTPQLLFGMKYDLYRQSGTSYRLLTDRAVKLGYQGIGNPNEPFISWYQQNSDSNWYDEESSTPEMTGGGGGGAFWDTNDNIGTTPLPTFNICASNFIQLYKLTAAQLTDLGNFLWDPSFAASIAKNWQSPFENIISLSLVPLDSLLDTSASIIQIGNIKTNIGGARINTQCYKLDMGEVDINEFYGGFQDYSPFQKLQIMLPFIGKRELNPDEFMDGKIHLYYNIDVFTGTVVAELIANKHGKYHLVESYAGNMSTQIPLTGTNFMSVYQSIISGVAGIASGSGMGFFSGMQTLLNAKPTYEKTGSISGSVGRLTVKRPYVFKDRPQFKTADTFRTLHGYVSNRSAKLSECKGFTQVKYIDLTNIDLTDTEKEELLNILQNGVYINRPNN